MFNEFSRKQCSNIFNSFSFQTIHSLTKEPTNNVRFWNSAVYPLNINHSKHKIPKVLGHRCETEKKCFTEILGIFWWEFFLTPRRISFSPAIQFSSCWCSTTHLIIPHSTSIWCHRFPGINMGAPRACDKNVFSGEPSQWKPESQVLEGFTHW